MDTALGMVIVTVRLPELFTTVVAEVPFTVAVEAVAPTVVPTGSVTVIVDVPASRRPFDPVLNETV